MFKTIDRYIAKSYFVTFLICLACAFILYVIGDSLSHLSKFTKEAAKHEDLTILGVAVHYYLVYLPRYYYHLGPVIIMMAALFTIVRLQKQNEVLTLMASGVPVQRICLPIFVVTIFLSLSLLMIIEAFIPVWPYKKPMPSFQKEIYPDTIRDGNGTLFQAVAYTPDIEEAHPPAVKRRRPQGEPVGVVLIQRYPNGRLKTYISAQRARWVADEKYWLLEKGTKVAFRPDGTYEREGNRVALSNFDTYHYVTNIRPLDLTTTNPEELYIPSYLLWTQYQRRDLVHIKVKLHFRLAYFFQSFILLLIGLPLLLRETLHPVLAVVISIVISALFFFLSAVFQNLGNERILDPLIAVWLPYLLYSIIGVELFLRVRT